MTDNTRNSSKNSALVPQDNACETMLAAGYAVNFQSESTGDALRVSIQNGYSSPKRLSFDKDGDLWMVMANGDVLCHSFTSKKLNRIFTVKNLLEPFGFACFDQGPVVVLVTESTEYRLQKSTGQISVRLLERPLLGVKQIFPLKEKGAVAIPSVRSSAVQFSNVNEIELVYMYNIAYVCVTPDGTRLVTCDAKGNVSTRDVSNLHGREISLSFMPKEPAYFRKHSSRNISGSVRQMACNNSKIIAVFEGILGDLDMATKVSTLQDFVANRITTVAVSSKNVIAYCMERHPSSQEKCVFFITA
eukprot:Rmarinus@m.11547